MEHITKTLISWASILEDKTREQALTASTMPFIYPHLALMPDAHLGMGATVGSVIPTLGAIMPAAPRPTSPASTPRRTPPAGSCSSARSARATTSSR